MGTISAEGTGGIGGKLEGKVAVITGGDSGIGLAATTGTALELYEQMLLLYPDRVNPGAL